MEFKERSAAVKAQEYLQYLIQIKSEQAIPSQRELAEQLHISRNAVMHALERLKSEKLISVKERTGIVPNSKIDINMLNMQSMTAELKDKSIDIKHLSTEVITKPSELNDFFNSSSTRLIKIRRVRINQNIPLTYEVVYFDQNQFPQLEEIDFTNKPLYQFLEKQYKIEPTYGRESISCCLANEKQSKILKIAPNTPLYRVQSFNYYNDDIPLETTTQYLVGSQFKYHFNAKNIYDYREEQ